MSLHLPSQEREPLPPGTLPRRGPREQPAADLLQKLKRETEDAHVAIERSVRFLDSDAPLSAYRAYLERLLGFYEPIEPLLLNVGREVPLLAMERRGKAALLERDLQVLGLPPEQLPELPRCPRAELPELPTLQHALGCLYVLEGATLGGRYVYHRLSTRFPQELAAAAAFLRCYGTETRARWLEFGQALAHYAEDPAQIVSSARQTFHSLHRWLRG